MKVTIDRADLTEMIIDYAQDKMGLKILPKDIAWTYNGNQIDKPPVEAQFSFDSEVNEE
jgi:hypothetical protein